MSITASSLSFLYSPLQQPLREVRLLEIRHGEETEHISATLKHVFLDTNPQYEALSYTWGDEPVSFAIEIDGKASPVRNNLYAALKRVRKRDISRMIWIDAICVNQQDIPERNIQVSRMRTIYEKAERVLIWLGEEKDDSRWAMDATGKKLHGQTHTDGWASQANTLWSAFSALVAREWWKRVWVIQEVAVARSVLVMCGTDSLPWERLIANLAFVDRILKALGPEAPTAVYRTSELGFVFVLDAFRRSFREGDKDLVEVLQLFRPSLSTDPRDKVFGLLNLTVADGDRAFAADYSLPTSIVYKN